MEKSAPDFSFQTIMLSGFDLEVSRVDLVEWAYKDFSTVVQTLLSVLRGEDGRKLLMNLEFGADKDDFQKMFPEDQHEHAVKLFHCASAVHLFRRRHGVPRVAYPALVWKSRMPFLFDPAPLQIEKNNPEWLNDFVRDETTTVASFFPKFDEKTILPEIEGLEKGMIRFHLSFSHQKMRNSFYVSG